MSADDVVPTASCGTVLQRLARALVFKRLARWQYGVLEVIDPDAHWQFGAVSAAEELSAMVYVHDMRFYVSLMLGGSIGAGQGYIDGTWACHDLTTLMRLLIRNKHVLYNVQQRGRRLQNPLYTLAHWLRRNTLQGSRRNIAAHYDLGNEFFALFLDETMTYSCAIFDRPTTALYDASVAKNDLVCRKLALRPGEHVLEIGGGWGGLALHAARHYGCYVTTTTLSPAQYTLAVERVKSAGLEAQITVLLTDYRQLRGVYDKIVSIEMIEAVGYQYFDTYFRTCSRLLKPTGLMFLQAITIHDQQYAAARKSVDFIKYFIFPGSCLPSVSAIADCVARVTDLRITHLDDIGPHYATTLRHWRERFMAQQGHLKRLGYSAPFQRMWEFYLCYCEAGFRERHISDVQILLAKPRCCHRLRV